MFDPCCEKSNYQMSGTQNVILRVAIVLGMVVAVMAVLYLTPIPEPYFKSCDRPCHTLDWPMMCRVKIHIHHNHSQIMVNGQNSGPSIQICQNDVLIVDIINQIPGHSLSVHWRGQKNQEAPYMDGVPLITQCPVSGYNTFQYKFKATEAGTHLYHAFSDQDRNRGIFGGLVVRQADTIDPHKKYYDEDLKIHVAVIAENNNAVLVNGKNVGEVFEVKKNKRYRFRVGFAGSWFNCPVKVSVDNHLIKVIALDGNPSVPIEVNEVNLQKGERVDFVLKTNQDIGNYSLRVKSCRSEGVGVVVYEGVGRKEKSEKKKEGRVFTTELCESEIGLVCGNDAKSLRAIPETLTKSVDKKVFLAFKTKIIVNGKTSSRVYATNNLTFTYPPSPLLTQFDQVPLNIFCYGSEQTPKYCEDQDVCTCVHVEYVPLRSNTELILVNQDETEHVFHLHGYSFYVVGYKQFNKIPTLEEMKSLDRENVLFKRNFNNPIEKDTIRISGNSVVAIRFQANNPGFWMLRDENSGGWTRGLDVILQVGGAGDMLSAPEDFPTCGNYIGPDFIFM